MEKMKVLVLDNDIVVRQAIAGILSRESDVVVRVSGELTQSEQLVNEENPDVVLLDIEDSAPDGFTIFNTLRVRFPKLPVVVISSRSEGGAQAALYALRKGAVDVITKPEKSNALLFATRHLAKRLPPMIQGIKRVVGSDALDGWTAGKKEARSLVDTEEQPEKEKAWMNRGPVRLIVIGGSMGGPKALNDILRKLPADFPVPVVAVQHLPKFYTRALARLLKEGSPLAVREALEESALTPGTALLASGGRHCEIAQRGNRPFVKVHRGPRENGDRPSIDVLFRSAARLYGRDVLGIILSGNGVDGLSGARAIREGGGRVIIQDPGDAVVDDLPLSVMGEGLADHYYPAEQISRQLLKHVLQPLGNRKMKGYEHVNLFNRDQEYFRNV
ncbi:two-component system, chemotaxis family, response regulator CheB [Fodinibius roseus]|uniref:protein-glutamate methylesterase n=1 Tax=Fodinibius roseus TaxID=1194090 RepID=A0A1M4X5I2_9BACT|nr:chemotaxis protein CheB [Fodinibius roseus]SHE88729.1 two-component system, chemotaxis family, response regulator CheB [Fodinibius roseus]